LGVVDEVQLADSLKARRDMLPARRLRVAPTLDLVVVERHRLDPGA
jgi:hypothetical protein